MIRDDKQDFHFVGFQEENANTIPSEMNVGRFAYKSFRLQVDSPTLTSIRLHDLSCFTEVKINKD